MDERRGLEPTQASATLVMTLGQNRLYSLEYCLCVWQGKEGNHVLECGL